MPQLAVEAAAVAEEARAAMEHAEQAARAALAERWIYFWMEFSEHADGKCCKAATVPTGDCRDFDEGHL